MSKREVIIKDTHRGLKYEDGILVEVLGAGRYVIPWRLHLGFYQSPRVEIVPVDMREQDLRLENLEVLTADRATVGFSVTVRFRVTDPKVALHGVADYRERLTAEARTAVRRAAAHRTLEDLLTNRKRLGEHVIDDLQEAAGRCGLDVLEVIAGDPVLPGDLREAFSHALIAEKQRAEQLAGARTRVESERIALEARLENERLEAAARGRDRLAEAETAAEIRKIRTQADIRALREWEEAVSACEAHPALLRIHELDALRELGQPATAHVHLDSAGNRPPPPPPKPPPAPRTARKSAAAKKTRTPRTAARKATKTAAAKKRKR